MLFYTGLRAQFDLRISSEPRIIPSRGSVPSWGFHLGWGSHPSRRCIPFDDPFRVKFALRTDDPFRVEVAFWAKGPIRGFISRASSKEPQCTTSPEYQDKFTLCVFVYASLLTTLDNSRNTIFRNSLSWRSIKFWDSQMYLMHLSMTLKISFSPQHINDYTSLLILTYNFYT